MTISEPLPLTTAARIVVVKPGWCTTVQDLGRYGHQQYGVSVSGAMDRLALTIANRLVGNRDRDAALEITLKGPELQFERKTVIAITGADLSPSLNGTGLPLWSGVPVEAGSQLTFGAQRTGARCYLAVTGGIEAPVVWGSRATHLSTRTGGIEGRALAAGEALAGGTPPPHAHEMIGRGVPERLLPVYPDLATLRILPGPQDAAFPAEAMATLTSATFKLSSRCDRMGYRLEGPRLTQVGPTQGISDGISDGTAMGALQVPTDGQPILLMADRPTTGGYPKIAVVISADLHLAGQLAPGQAVTFRTTTLLEAQASLLSQWTAFTEAVPPVRGGR